ncbi:hypothetical protein BJV77DRAFT_698917 [Russula vinacea]|nr:hypothetical protein BJV77DRAFT_698917 [Russula vinacea]
MHGSEVARNAHCNSHAPSHLHHVHTTWTRHTRLYNEYPQLKQAKEKKGTAFPISRQTRNHAGHAGARTPILSKRDRSHPTRASPSPIPPVCRSSSCASCSAGFVSPAPPSLYQLVFFLYAPISFPTPKRVRGGADVQAICVREVCLERAHLSPIRLQHSIALPSKFLRPLRILPQQIVRLP